MSDKKLRVHFSLGNSTKGAIGYCAVIYASTVAEAVEKLKKVVPADQRIDPCGDDEDNDQVDYIEAYFNENAISAKDVDFIEDADGAEHDGTCAIGKNAECNCG